MSYAFPEGSRFLFSNTFAAAKTVTAASNADPTVLSATAHGLLDDDEFLFDSGWEDASDSVYKADTLTADTVSPVDLNTVNTTWYPPGSGIGTIQKVTNWLEIPQVLTIATTGGDPRYTTISPLARRNSINVPTGFNATSITLTLGHDASNANYQAMLEISRTLQKVAFKMVLSGAGPSYGYGYLAVSEIPSLNVGQPNQVTASFSLLGRSISYPA